MGYLFFLCLAVIKGFFTSARGIWITIIVVVGLGLGFALGSNKSSPPPKPPKCIADNCAQITGEYCQKKCGPFSVKDYRPGYWLCPATDGTYLAFTNPYSHTEQSSLKLEDICDCGP